MRHLIAGSAAVVAAILILFLSVLVGFDILARNVVGNGFIGTHDLLTIGLTFFFFAVLPYSFYEDAHVRMDILYANSGRWLRGVADFFGVVGALLFLGSIVWGAASRVGYMMLVKTATPTIGIPMWPLAALVAISCFAAILVMLLGCLPLREKNGQVRE